MRGNCLWLSKNITHTQTYDIMTNTKQKATADFHKIPHYPGTACQDIFRGHSIPGFYGTYGVTALPSCFFVPSWWETPRNLYQNLYFASQPAVLLHGHAALLTGQAALLSGVPVLSASRAVLSVCRACRPDNSGNLTFSTSKWEKYMRIGNDFPLKKIKKLSWQEGCGTWVSARALPPVSPKSIYTSFYM